MGSKSECTTVQFLTDVSTSGDDKFGNASVLQKFADGFWLPDHVTEDQAVAIILDEFGQIRHGHSDSAAC